MANLAIVRCEAQIEELELLLEEAQAAVEHGDLNAEFQIEQAQAGLMEAQGRLQQLRAQDALERPGYEQECGKCGGTGKFRGRHRCWPCNGKGWQTGSDVTRTQLYWARRADA